MNFSPSKFSSIASNIPVAPIAIPPLDAVAVFAPNASNVECLIISFTTYSPKCPPPNLYPAFAAAPFAIPATPAPFVAALTPPIIPPVTAIEPMITAVSVAKPFNAFVCFLYSPQDCSNNSFSSSVVYSETFGFFSIFFLPVECP